MTQSTLPAGSKLCGGARFPEFQVPKSGGGTLRFGGTQDRWSLLIVYRGKHCGRCKNYLNKFEKSYADWKNSGFDVACVSADPLEKVTDDIARFGWTFDIGYDLQEDDMRKMGLYISDPLSAQETDRRFAEPGVFCIRPDGTAQIIAISNGPAARPDLDELLDGMIFTIENERPARGTV
ncbi:ahpC/TSA family protein [Roseovarius sp. A-2]|uniref:redoxin domain-containing protein n=1 Tax=Roseovarius sp. A-2 TaxID=1570360 RepID=UPI0009B533E4|nr:redoxin domain-containing protein [Roseovarius sp. A-2]GAW36381.1 ahpC/TSA family protein [Roseovarius sp. A-2]